MSNEFNTGRWSRIFRPKPQIEVDDEFAFHLEERVREYVARGMSPEAAHAAALERFGDVQGIREECTQMLTDERRAEVRSEWISDMGQDVRFGIRSALRAPLFSLLAVLTLALGIGANAAVFGVVKSVLLDALPYADADDVAELPDGGTIEIAGLAITVDHAPGHTGGSVLFRLPGAGSRWEADEICLSGDVLFAGSIGRTDLPGGSLPTMLASLRSKILPLADDTVVLPGHGPATTVGRERATNPYLIEVAGSDGARPAAPARGL